MTTTEIEIQLGPMHAEIIDQAQGDEYQQALALARIRTAINGVRTSGVSKACPELIDSLTVDDEGTIQVVVSMLHLSSDAAAITMQAIRTLAEDRDWKMEAQVHLAPWDMGYAEPYLPEPGTMIVEPLDFKEGGVLLAKAAIEGSWRGLFRIVLIGDELLTESLEPMPHPYRVGQVVSVAGQPQILPGSEAEHLRPRLLVAFGSLTSWVLNPELASGDGTAFRKAAEDKHRRLSARRELMIAGDGPRGPSQAEILAGKSGRR